MTVDPDSASVPWPRRAHQKIVGALERRREALTGWLQRRFVGTQIFVTGSCGKSTAVRLLGALLEGEGRVQVFGHPNNDKHLLRPHRRHRRRVDFVVQEASAYGPGALARVTRTLRLDIVVVTAVGLDHSTNYRGTGIDPLEAVALEKGRLAEAVHPDGTVCLNADDPHVAAMATRCRGKVLTFGTAEGASLRATNLEVDWLDGMRFDLVFEGRNYPVSARLASPLLLPSVLGALAAAAAGGVPIEVAIERLSRAQPLPQHMSTHLGNDGRTYILDTFKASFWSTERLMDTLDGHRGPPLTVVLGDISDLGPNGGNKYRRLIRRAAASADEVVLTAGSASRGLKVLNEGFTNIVLAPALTDVADHIAKSRNRVVLLKSNSSAHLERVVESVGISLPPHP